jgi:voltage-gated potassium channel
MPRARRRTTLRTKILFGLRMARDFRWTLSLLATAVLLLGTLYAVTPHAQLGGRPPSLLTSYFGAWMALFAQPILTPPETWYLAALCGIYPLLGFVLIGEGVVRVGMLILSRERGEKEWMQVTASTYRDHIVLCGLGHLGYRILTQLIDAEMAVVALEKATDARFLADAKATGTPVLVRDMKEDQALLDAGVPYARAIVIATNDDMANLEVALDARRLNPKIRVIMRLFDQRMADKFKEAALIDEAFSPAALAAPIVAEMALRVTRGG